MNASYMLITKVSGTLRLSDEDRWEVTFEFEIVNRDETVETWTNGTGWTELGWSPDTPGFNGLQLAGEAALSAIEGDIERRGCRPKHAFSRFRWTGMDSSSRRALSELGELP